MNILKLYRNSFSGIQHHVWILASAMFINRSGSMVLLFASLYFTKELHFNMTDAGLIMSCYGIGSIVGSYVGGWLTDRKNAYTIMQVSLISCGLILLSILFTQSKLLIAFIIFSYAFAADMFRPANSSSIATFSTTENRTRSISLMRLAINLGFSVGPAIGGFVAMYLGYKCLFVIDAFSSFGAAALLFFYLPKKINQPHAKAHHILNDVKTSAYRDYIYLIFISLTAVYGICFFQIFASIPQYFDRVSHYTESTIGWLMALNGFIVVVMEMPVVSYLENRKNKFNYIIWGCLCIAVALMILYIGQSFLWMAIIYTFAMTFSEIFAMPFMMSFVLARGKQERQGQYSALYSIAYGIANIAAPSIGLAIAQHYGFNSMFVFFSILSVLAAIGFWRLRKIAFSSI
jgi:predicted MFS family arabinose efflux permease